MSDLNAFCSKLINRFPGTSVIVADRDGFVLAKAIDTNTMEEKAIENSLLSTFSLATDQASKLRAGKNKSIVSYFDDKVVFHLNVNNVIVSILGDSDLNVGVLLGAQDEIVRSLTALSNSIQDVHDI
ncbi:hypothetical protein PPL_09975 [Heterostelium album PN500]|uniref:Roadblock/LAMTOR2 domain-containing protein n=1 Tax=Heterostelium pallidum (strain ATCC 26659 / Pp 5 / PN500) TaxID=670386 RepID=D3BPT1_HETP5|nr:hypothetical protein PPL_09975 [Heterostelium album PN500]EFA76214.1 hypothetical protein PPL_09975 [Heterostelium album PN500]|eukprot:XP_020428347.1 hypothetical protein PPL_09975 [Heterostelium album PN500]